MKFNKTFQDYKLLAILIRGGVSSGQTIEEAAKLIHEQVEADVRKYANHALIEAAHEALALNEQHD
jgi:hypothetical protein